LNIIHSNNIRKDRNTNLGYIIPLNRKALSVSLYLACTNKVLSERLHD